MSPHKNSMDTLIEKLQEQLKSNTKSFYVDNENLWVDNKLAIKWCEENLDDDCWFFESRGISTHFYIKGEINIIAFKLRWS